MLSPCLHGLRMTCLVTALLNGLPAIATSAERAHGQQSYETCSMITAEYLTVVQLHERGLDADALKASLPGLTEQGAKRVETLHRLVGEQGAQAVYERVNAEYVACAKAVYQRKGIPPLDSREFQFYFCAGENKRRYDILLAIQMGGSRDEVLPQLQEGMQRPAEELYRIVAADGAIAAYDALATELKLCLNDIP